jgi:hypothetical protein
MCSSLVYCRERLERNDKVQHDSTRDTLRAISTILIDKIMSREKIICIASLKYRLRLSAQNTRFLTFSLQN